MTIFASMDGMEQFRRNAKKLGLCETFSQKWAACGSKLQLYKLACDINSLSYMAEMTAKGYGLSAEYLTQEFGQFLNGKCIYDADGYTSCIYCLPEDLELTIETTAALIIGHDGIVTIPKNRICELYLCQSDVQIQGEGKGVAYLYDSAISNPDTAPVVIKEDKKY